MAAGTRVPCDGQINCISKERKQCRKKKCLNTWIRSLWAGRFFHVTSHLEPGESSSGLKGQNKVSCFNSSATWNEESLFCRQKSGSKRHLRHATRWLRHTLRASITEVCDLICAKRYNTKLISVYNAAGCVKHDTETVHKRRWMQLKVSRTPFTAV